MKIGLILIGFFAAVKVASKIIWNIFKIALKVLFFPIILILKTFAFARKDDFF